MAIGIPLPPGNVPRLRHPKRYAGTVFSHPITGLQAGIVRVLSVTQVLWNRLLGVNDLFNLRARARQRQRARLTAFEKQYDDLIDLLCAAAHEGIQSERESAYTGSRAFMLAHYPRIARQVRSHWEFNGEGSVDPFEPLFIHESLEDAVNGETGIEDIMRSRSALEAYREELDAPRE